MISPPIATLVSFTRRAFVTSSNSASIHSRYSPRKLKAFEQGSFTPRERQLILLAASVENHCNYCAAAHSTVAKGALHTPAEVVSAIRNNTPVPDAKLNALVTLVKELVREGGYAKDETIQKFIAVGYKKEQVMELLLGIAMKTISNYLDHISPAPVDQAFAAESKQSIPFRKAADAAFQERTKP